MKYIKFVCDSPNCNNFTNLHENNIPNGWLTIGNPDNNTLEVVNNLPDPATLKVSAHQAIHFCSKDCLIDFLFTE